MVRDYVLGRGIREPRILQAMEKVPRHLFVDGALGPRSYGDYALPIGAGQTISQPFVIGLTTWALDLKDGDKVLEVGTGSGYQSAILAEIAGQVFSIERLAEVARRARRVLDQLGYLNIAIRIMDGFYGWKEEAPFDAILVSAATPSMPWTLLEQLRLGGKLVMPVQEGGGQQLVQLERQEKGCRRQVLGPCRFVPLKSSYPG